MSTPDLSRRAFLQGSVIAGIGVSFAPLGSKAFAALFEAQVTAIERVAQETGRDPQVGAFVALARQHLALPV